MKICYLADASSTHTIRWVNSIVSLGHNVSLLTMHSNNNDKIDPRVEVYLLNFTSKFGYYLNVIEAKKIISKLKPDVLNAHYASGYGTLARLVNYKPTLLSVWGSDVYLFPYQSKRKERILRKNLQAADQIASTSKAMKKQTKQFVNHSTPIAVTPFGINLNLFKPIKKKKDNYIVLGTVKGLEAVYGIDILLSATAKLVERLKSRGYSNLANNIRLNIVGKGTELLSLQHLAKSLKIDHITKFLGEVPNSLVPSYLNEFDIYCAFSRSESFGVAVLEASACELPVVVSNIGGLPEVVQDGKTGLLVCHENLDEIVDNLYILVLDEEKRNLMGKEGRQFVHKYYNWENNVLNMIDVYENLIKRQK